LIFTEAAAQMLVQFSDRKRLAASVLLCDAAM